MASITSCNIACGSHAGDPEVMRRTVRLARDNGVAIGAHPGLPDLVGLRPARDERDARRGRGLVLVSDRRADGDRARRRASRCSTSRRTARSTTWRSATRGWPTRSRAPSRRSIRSLLLFGLPGYAAARAREAAGLPVAAEGFADRSYEPDGSLTPRSQPGAVIHDADAVVARAVRMARDGVVLDRDGDEIPMRVETICTHGDTPGSARAHAAARAKDSRPRASRCAPWAANERRRGAVRRAAARMVRAPTRPGAARAGRRHARLDARRVRRDALRAGAAGRRARRSACQQRAAACSAPSRSSPAPPAGSSSGWIADRFGRTRALMAQRRRSIRSSPPRAASRRTFRQFVVFRVFLGFGMGGEWASGAALVSETWAARASRQGARPDAERLGGRLRAPRRSSTASCSRAYGWRAVFFVGILPAFFALWIQRRVKEPAIWTLAGEAVTTRSSAAFAGLFDERLARLTIALTLHERLHAVRVVGLQPVAAELPRRSRRAGRRRPERRLDLRLHARDAGRHVVRLRHVRLRQRCARAQADATSRT